jgi:hypothetical protein
MRRMPWINAPCPADTKLKNTTIDSSATAVACWSLPKVKVDTCPESPIRKTAPRAPRNNDIRFKTVAVRAILTVSPEPTASAICRTPLLLMPIPAILIVRSVIDPYSPSNPTPEGPSNIAMALVRTTPMAILSTDDPPINAEDFKICP